jgi:hypothetical protein
LGTELFTDGGGFDYLKRTIKRKLQNPPKASEGIAQFWFQVCFIVTLVFQDFAPLNTDTGATATMKTKFTHCLTLRLTPEMDSLLCDAAYDAHLPKSGWIRLAIESFLRQRRQRKEAVLR